MNNTISIDLGLPDVKIKEFNTDSKGNYHIKICSTKTTGICRCCGKKTDKFHAEDREMKIRHLPILGKECYLYIRLPRYECSTCDKNPKTTQQMPWRNYNSSNTKHYETYILNLLVNSTIIDVSRKENISEGVITRILKSYYPDKIDWDNFDNLGQLGIDEISLKKRA